MAIADGSILTAADLNLLPRPFASTAARDAAITSPTAGMKCVIGSGATMVEYVWNGAAWQIASGSHYAAPYAAAMTPAAIAGQILVRNGIASGTTTAGGVLTTNFALAFPTACIAVIFLPNQNRAGGLVVEAGVTAAGFQSFWAGYGNAAVACQYIAFGY